MINFFTHINTNSYCLTDIGFQSYFWSGWIPQQRTF